MVKACYFLLKGFIFTPVETTFVCIHLIHVFFSLLFGNGIELLYFMLVSRARMIKNLTRSIYLEVDMQCVVLQLDITNNSIVVV